MHNITAGRFTNGQANLRRYHQAKWDEPIIFDLSTEGERAYLPPETETGIKTHMEKLDNIIPSGMIRTTTANLPEISQNRLVRHYLRLSQQNLGADFNVDIGQGTCTMKYNPKVNEKFARHAKVAHMHPRQPLQTAQGMLKILYDTQTFMQEVSGLPICSLTPRAGSQAIYANASVVRAYFEDCGEGDTRDEIITTIFSHPSDAAAPKVAGYKVITLYSDDSGLPDIEALKSAVSDRTAALFITNPEDTGIYNPYIKDFVEIVHQAGGLCVYDQANANGLLGIACAKDAGFDLCHFNLHKTFGAPHGCGGPGAGAICAVKKLAPFMPIPHIAYDGDMYYPYAPEKTCGRIASFIAPGSVIVRTYAWVMALGADGLKQVAQTAVLNNNYVMKKLLEIKGLSLPYAKGKHRIEQARYSWQELFKDTGVHSGQIGIRAADFGVHYWTSHHPYVVPEPTTVEPTEAYSKKDLDEFVQILQHIADEAYTHPEIITTAPHNCPVSQVDESGLDDPKRWATSWRGYKRKNVQL